MYEEICKNLKIRCPCKGLFSLNNAVQHEKSLRHRRYLGLIPPKFIMSNSTKTRIWYESLSNELKSEYMLIESDK